VAPRLAGLLHMVEHAGDAEPWGTSISGETMQRAARLVQEYLVPHASAAFYLMEADPALGDAEYLAGWIARAGRVEFTLTEAQQPNRARFKKAGDIHPALRMLEEHGYIRCRAVSPARGPGRKPSPVYDVNPALLGTLSEGGTANSQHCQHSQWGGRRVDGQGVANA
jgi:replicative DNA helicase